MTTTTRTRILQTVLPAVALVGLLAGAQSLEARNAEPTPGPTMSRHETPIEPYGGWDEANQDGIAEDHPQWNCLTMGDFVCGPTYVPVTPEQADNLSEGSDEGSAYPWESCLIDIDSTTTVVCPDGTVVTS